MDTSKKKNKRGRTKVFKSCFKPTIDFDDHAPPPESFRKSSEKGLGKPVLIAVNGKGKLLLSDGNSVVPASGNTDRDLVVAGLTYDPKRNSSSRRRISRIFKAVLFDTAVSKKIRKKKPSKNSNDSDVSLSPSLSSERYRDAQEDKSSDGGNDSSDTDSPSNIFSPSSRTASSTYSTSCCSSMSSNSRSLSSDRKGSSRVNSLDRKLSLPSTLFLTRQSHGKRIGGYQLDIVLCLFILLSLLVLVVWGRICAIFCTSIWLYLGTYRRAVYHVVSPNTADSSDNESEHNKKRLITEGPLPLPRNRNPGR